MSKYSKMFKRALALMLTFVMAVSVITVTPAAAMFSLAVGTTEVLATTTGRAILDSVNTTVPLINAKDAALFLAAWIVY